MQRRLAVLFSGIQHRKALIVLLAIYVLGLWLRLNNLDHAVWAFPGYDDSRDALVAKHLAEYGQLLWRGPMAASGFGWLLNSPFYYYLLAVLWLIFGSAFGLLQVWAVLLSSNIPLAYLAGKKTLDRTTGLIFATIVAVHPLFIKHSQEMFQPHLLPPLVLLIYIALLNASKKSSLKNMLWLIFTISLPVHFHYSIFILSPVLLFWLGKTWHELLKKEFSYRTAFMPLAAAITGLMVWVLFTYNWFVFDQLYFFIFNFEKLAGENTPLLASLANTFYYTIELLIPYWPDGYRQLLFGLILLLAGLMIKKSTLQQRRNGIILASFASGILFTPLFGAEMIDYYATPIYPFWLLLFALGFRFAFKKNMAAGFFILLAFLLIWRGRALEWYSTLPQTPIYDETKVISQVLAKHIGPKPTQFALVGLGTNNTYVFDYWPTSAFWFHLEEIYQTPLVYLIQNGVNHQPIIGNPHTIFMICDHRTLPELIDLRCLYRFESNRAYLALPPEQLYQSERYSVWKYQLQPEAQSLYYNVNVVYDDFKEY